MVRLEGLGEADGAQLGHQVLPLPIALSLLIDLASAVESHGFRGLGRGVRRVNEHVSCGARLAGSTSRGHGGR